jgi:superfamily II DNA or RNA helicase
VSIAGALLFFPCRSVAAVQKLTDRPHLAVGDVVSVRRQSWRIDAVEPFDACELLQLTGAGATNLGTRRRLLVPFDRVVSGDRPSRTRAVAMRTWRAGCRHHIANAAPAAAAMQAIRASIDLLPHQLEPVLAILRGDSSRLLIADDVGLGKTIQAGLIIAELLARGAAARALVLCPSGVRDQWAGELAERFRLDARIADQDDLRRQRRELPLGVNPWAIAPLVVASFDYAKRTEVLPSVLACDWDILVVDEAHHASSPSERTRAVEALAARAAHVVLLSATPHNGDPRAFAALCSLGAYDDELLIFRRRRSDMGLDHARTVHRLDVRPTAEERQLHLRLARLERAVHREQPVTPDRALTLALLRKRALSSACALAQSVRRRIEHLRSDAEGAMAVQLPLPLADYDVDDADKEPPWTSALFRDPDTEREHLTALLQAAQKASAAESKISALRRLLRRVKEPVLIFTEYRDTLAHIRASVAPTAAVIHGGMSRAERRAALASFGDAGLLVATDAAGEGLNLQDRCRLVVNVELPWSPTRLEQRIGRVDRIGQRRRVHAIHLVSSGTYEERVLARLRQRVARAATAVGAANPLSDADWTRTATRSHDLGDEAEQEHRRLVLARALLRIDRHGRSRRDRATTERDRDTLSARTRSRDTRTYLQGRHLVVLRQSIHDGAGRKVAQTLLPVLTRSAATIDNVARLLTIDPPAPLTRWREDALRTHRAYWERRMARERHIARTAGPTHRSPAQPGLFDKRLDRRPPDHLEAAHEAREERARRQTMLTAMAQVACSDLHPVLILRSSP